MEGYPEHHHRRGKKAAMLFVFGLVIVVVRIYMPSWDIWVVIGAMMMLKALFMAVMSMCCPKSCQGLAEEKKA
ncbi:MAG: hypothetical protein PHG85_05375 [Candidatus Altiarchaeota archaeon]|nr:hypothetical protein [Candidatus Altiarchaeota archaeon]